MSKKQSRKVTREDMERMSHRHEMMKSLLRDCPEDEHDDCVAIAKALESGNPKNVILAMPETNRHPETYHWISVELRDEPLTQGFPVEC
jgi:hypothetical protein